MAKVIFEFRPAISNFGSKSVHLSRSLNHVCPPADARGGGDGPGRLGVPHLQQTAASEAVPDHGQVQR